MPPVAVSVVEYGVPMTPSGSVAGTMLNTVLVPVPVPLPVPEPLPLPELVPVAVPVPVKVAVPVPVEVAVEVDVAVPVGLCFPDPEHASSNTAHKTAVKMQIKILTTRFLRKVLFPFSCNEYQYLWF